MHIVAVKWGVFMQKNFRIDWKQRKVTCVWSGHYELKQLTSSRLQCVLDEYLVIIEGEAIEVEAMYEQQLIVVVENLKKLNFEASDE